MLGTADRRGGGAVRAGEFVHSLGTAVALALVAGCLPVLLAGGMRERALRQRLGRLLGRAGPVGPERWRPPGLGRAGPGGSEGWRRPRFRWGRTAPGSGDAREAARQLPFAADLLAACLAAGAGPREAAEVVGEALGGPVGERLARAGAELRLGGEPGAAWGRLAELPEARPLAECLARAARTGAPAADPVSRLAAGLREDRARTATARAQRAAVLITAPVGLCFLPAFLAVGVAPVVIGLAAGLLGGR
ncbi:type II secretion system F family protein [Streptomyces sp. NPDC089919]|uniref:type II secretion system F family protein n=1 Tax=Streptomyces sp. NPDC089919 TaxID=3155188 RepID=UPI00342971D8